MREKPSIINRGGIMQKLKIAFIICGLMLGVTLPHPVVQASTCPNLRIVFARGSGGELGNDQNYLDFKSTIDEKLKSTHLNYEFIDLAYPAVGIGIDKLDVTLGALFGAGDAYEFGESVNSGVSMLQELINSAECPATKYVIGGYSQGAMVISKSLGGLNADRIIYAATFGDPKIFLPEGEGIIPPACTGEELSDYRMYVPDCRAYKGMLGAYIPYEPETLIGKVGTWCNKNDIFCSSHLNISDHTSYVSDNLYEDASRTIYDKVTRHFNIDRQVISPHDTAILIDSSGSMADFIERYKSEALRLASETLNSGGRVALYDYRDLNDPYTPVKHCDFETCTIEILQSELASIETQGGGDAPESLLSASLYVMKDLNWKYGATKSLVALTDADFHSPDRDGVTFNEVVALSKQIDPVNFYSITQGNGVAHHKVLANATNGKVATNFNELSLLTNYILERYDSLPKVEESNNLRTPPTLTLEKIEQSTGAEATIDFSLGNGGTSVLVSLNDAVLGVVGSQDGTGTVKISGLDANIENVVALIPLGNDIRGDRVEVTLTTTGLGEASTPLEPTNSEPTAPSDSEEFTSLPIDNNSTPSTTSYSLARQNDSTTSVIYLPKAPNTGKK